MSETADRIAGDVALAMKRAAMPVVAGVSNRHFHITEADWRTLYGSLEPKKLREVRQPGQWAGEATADIQGPKGTIRKVRFLGPFRKHTQVEISRSDAFALGIDPPVRGSGTLQGAAAVRMVGPKGSVELREGCIIAQRHIHFSTREAERFQVKNGDMLRVRAGAGGPREVVFEKVLARVTEDFALEFHVDIDEANAAFLKTGDQVFVI